MQKLATAQVHAHALPGAAAAARRGTRWRAARPRPHVSGSRLAVWAGALLALAGVCTLARVLAPRAAGPRVDASAAQRMPDGGVWRRAGGAVAPRAMREREVELPTHIGTVRVRVWEPQLLQASRHGPAEDAERAGDDGLRGMALLLHGAAKGTESEWAPFGPRLAAMGMRVAMPVWHSAEEAPSRRPDAEMRASVQLVLEQLQPAGIGFAVVMGKSWGGRLAASFAAAYPQLVSRLVLCAPAGMTGGAGARDLAKLGHQGEGGVPVLLAWAEDDAVGARRREPRAAGSAR